VRVDTVFFDAGETLLTPKGTWSGMSADILRERGHDVSVETLQAAWRHGGQHFLNAAEDGVMFSLSDHASHTFWTSLYHDMLDFLEIDDEEAPEILYATFSDPANYKLFDDAVPTLRALRERGLKLGVISNFESWLNTMLEVLDVTIHFDVVAVSGDLGWEKPDPRIFEWAMEQAGTEPSRSLHVGDSPQFDAQPAHDLGMTGVLLDRHSRWTDLSADYPVITSLRELIDLL
jgi:putative hydrolase of the HAD superfamily